MAGWIKMLLGREAGLDPCDIVLDGDPVPLPKKGTEPSIFVHVYCDQMARCIKMPLGMEVRLGPATLC